MARSGGLGVDWQITITAALTSVVHVEDISFPEEENVLDEITAHDSDDGYEEFIATGLKRSGEFEVTLTWDAAAATHAELVALRASGALNAMTLSTPGDAEVMAFNGIIKMIKRQSPIDEALRSVVTVKVTGPIVIT